MRRPSITFATASLLVLRAAAALAVVDLPVRGALLSLRASEQKPERRSAVLRIKDGRIAAPLSDPRDGGAAFALHGGASPGQCFVLVDLPASGWRAIRGNGARRGWRYRDRTGAAAGIRRAVVRPGRLMVVASGTEWPCDLAAPAHVPVTATLRVGAQRWCAAFGGTVSDNDPRRFRARKAVPPAACPDDDVTVADLNILHGLFCPGGDRCRFSDRMELLGDWLEAGGCPDVVTLQEVSASQAPTLFAQLAPVCGGTYTAVHAALNEVDNNVILARIPAISAELTPLAGGFRDVLHARLDHPLGPIDVFTTHLAATTDRALFPCADDCPAECLAAGATTRRACQAVQIARLVEDRHRLPTPAVVAGDFNEDPTSFAYAQLTMQGRADAYLAAGNPECDPATGAGCTSGRIDDALVELESPAINEVERIDFIFVPPAPTCRIEPAGDPDGDGTATGLFADRPNPFGTSCGPLPAPICWPSDHIGMQLDLNCG